MKNNILYVLFFFSTLFILNGCVTVKYNNNAVTDFDKAAKFIHQLKDDTILLALPMYHDEELIYKRAIKFGDKDREKNKDRLSILQQTRKSEAKEIIAAFDEHFNFAKVLYIPDSLVHRFESGEKGSYFVNANLELDGSITYNNRSPIKFIRPNVVTWHVVIENDILPNPFPNTSYYKNGLVIFLGMATHDKIINSIAKTFQQRFEKYYSNPASRLYY